MVTATKRACFFQRENIGRLFDHAEQVACARSVRANIAERFCREKTAARTGAHRLARSRDRARDRLRLIAARPHNPKRDSFRRARTDPRHLAKLRDQFPDRRGIFCLPQNRQRLTGPEACWSIAERAAPGAANTIAGAGPLLPRARARFEIASRPRPSVSRDTT